MVMGDTDLCPWDAGTWGRTDADVRSAARVAGSEARAVLMKLASEKLGTPAAALSSRTARCRTAQKVTYGELAKGRRSHGWWGEGYLRTVNDFKVIGKPARRMDAHEKVTGRAKYAGDIRRPGMLYARVLRPPMHGATRKALDASKAEAMDGVTVVERDDFVAVLGPDPERAAEALAAIKAEWDRPTAAFDTESVSDYFVKNGGEGHVSTSKGDVTTPAAGDHAIHSTFRSGYLAHAPMEPPALAGGRVGKMTVWASTQSLFGARTRIAKVLGLDERACASSRRSSRRVRREESHEQGVEAARLAQITGKPVMVT